MGEIYTKYADGKISWSDACNSAWFNRKCLSSVGHYSHPIPGFNFET